MQLKICNYFNEFIFKNFIKHFWVLSIKLKSPITQSRYPVKLIFQYKVVWWHFLLHFQLYNYLAVCKSEKTICLHQKQPPEVFFKKRCSSKFHKIHSKTPVPESFSIKLQAWLPATLLKKETLAQVFSCEFCEIFKNTFFYRIPPVAASIIHQITCETKDLSPTLFMTWRNLKLTQW